MSGKAKNWFTWALLALLPGVTGWFIVLTQQQIQQNRSETYKLISQQQKDEFLEMYKEWSRLTPQEKAENPWGIGPYGGPEIQKKLQQHQEERLLADLPDLLSENEYSNQLGDILYGTGWRTRLEEYRKQIEYQEILSVCSSVLFVTGGLGLMIGTTLWAHGKIAARRRQDTGEKNIASEKGQQISGTEEAGTDSSKQPSSEEVHLFTKKRSGRSASSGAQAKPCPPQEPPAENPPEESELVTVLTEAKEAKEGPVRDSPKQSTPKTRQQTAPQVAVFSDLFKEETDTGKDSTLYSLMTPQPVAKELTDLTEQMSAIREFAAEQQSQVKKLQDGYDWMLIKRFCLRIIRCIDNMEDRIRQLAAEQKETSALGDIRDEMVFALESSGVEPFEPQIGQDYRGLEKYAEAVKERVENKDPERTGKIAEIVRPGYQYLINDEEVKIVRCAQVKLYA